MPETNVQRFPRLGLYKDIFIVPQLHFGNRGGSRGESLSDKVFPQSFRTN